MLQVRIIIKGHLDSTWEDWVEGLAITYPVSGETLLCGEVPDQASLYGLIGKLRDLGIQLVSIQASSPP